jgi:hypothetical protein
MLRLNRFRRELDPLLSQLAARTEHWILAGNSLAKIEAIKIWNKYYN